MNFKDSIRNNSSEFLTLCKMHEVKSLYVFGSSVSNLFNENTSDIDLIVELKTTDPLLRGRYLFDLWGKFESFFNRKVDLLTNASIRNPILRESIDASKVLIYDGKNQKISI